MTQAVERVTAHPAEEAEEAKATALAGTIGIIAVGVYLVLLGAFLGSLLVGLWPAFEEIRSGPADESLSMNLLGGSFSLSPEIALLLLAIAFGALGAYIHALNSFADYVGNRRFERSWIWWYILRPFVGASLALVFYVAIRGGFFTQEAAADVNPFGVAALSGLAGLFSKNATDKLKEVFETLFRTEKGKGDDARRDPLSHPTPTLGRVHLAGGRGTHGGPVVQIVGTGFTKASTVLVGNSELEPTFVGPTELQVELPRELTSHGPMTVKVKNPDPGGGVSEAKTLELRRTESATRRGATRRRSAGR